MRTILTSYGSDVTEGELRRAYADGRMTPQRREIARAASSMTGAFSAADLAACVRAESPGVGLATVYRGVAALEASGWIARAGERDGAALYVCCSHEGHHHHLVCTGCGRVEHAACPVEPVLAEVAQTTGFRVTGHDVRLYGVCDACDRKGVGR